MSRGHFKHASLLGGRTLERCKRKNSTEKEVVIDVDTAESDVVIIDVPESSSRTFTCSKIIDASTSRTTATCSNEVISIEDDEETDRCSSSRNYSGLRDLSESSESESPQNTSDDQHGHDSDSDCEILEDTSGSILEQWEKAASRRRARKGKESGLEDNASISASSAEIRDQHQKDHDVLNTEGSKKPELDGSNEILRKQKNGVLDYTQDTGECSRGHSCTDTVMHKHDSMEKEHYESGTNNLSNEDGSFSKRNHSDCKEDVTPTSHANKSQHNSPTVDSSVQDRQMPFPTGKYYSEDQYLEVLHSGSSVSACQQTEDFIEKKANGFVENSETDKLSSPAKQGRQSLTMSENGVGPKITTELTEDESLQYDLISAREKQKESREYMLAVEKEWFARQQQLQIQSMEVQKLRNKRKRSLDMERRQKERLEEIRELQRKNEETMNLKDEIRAEVRRDLEQLENTYYNMASILRALGIPVGGGSFPSPSEVRAAYKQALLRFHPDRVPSSDVHQQVQAEETFKFISRLKDKLLF